MWGEKMSWICTWLRPSFRLHAGVSLEYVAPELACCAAACCGLAKHSVSATCPWGEDDKITPEISATPAVDFS